MPAKTLRPTEAWQETELRGVQVARLGPMRASQPVVSRPVLDVVQNLGEQSIDFVSLDTLARTAAIQLPPKAAADALLLCNAPTSKANRYRDLAHFVKDAVSGTKILEARPPEKMWVPVGELHRPKVDGCTSAYATGYQAEGGFDFGVKVVGTGFGTSVSQSFAVGEKHRTMKDCLRMEMEASVQPELIRTRKGEEQWRINVLSLKPKIRPVAIASDDDPCGRHTQDALPNSWWSEGEVFAPPDGVTTEKELTVSTAQTADFEVGFKLGGIELGIKTSVKLLRTLTTSYELVGPKTYTGYLPRGRISYYWNWK